MDNVLINPVDLVRACQSGDSQAFGRIYDLYIKQIYAFIYYKTHHKEIAQDLTSDTFFKALEHVKTFDVSRGTVKAWLYRIARNTVIDYYRTKKTTIDIEDAWDVSVDDKIETQTEIKIQIEKVRQYLKTFSAIERDVVIMRVWQELSYKEMAEIAGKSEENCKVIFSRTIRKLRDVMPLALFFLFCKFLTDLHR